MKARKKIKEESMETMACVDPEDTVSDSSPQERWMHASFWIVLILSLGAFWAFVAWLIFG